MSDTTNIKFLCPNCNMPFEQYTDMVQHSHSCGYAPQFVGDAITEAPLNDMKWSIVEGLVKRVEELEETCRKLRSLIEEGR